MSDADAPAALSEYNKDLEALNQVYLYLTLTVISYPAFFLLNCLRKQFRWKLLRLLTWGCYVSIPVLISYTIGLLAPPEAGRQYPFQYLVLSSFLLWGYSGFDNFICFSLQERNDRTIIFFQFIIQIILLLRYTRAYSGEGEAKHGQRDQLMACRLFFIPVFIAVGLKVVERVGALAHAAGATTGVKENLRRIFNYTNIDEEDHVDLVTMEGFKILVGPRYSKIKDDEIVDGISLEKIWGLFSSRGSNQKKLKDTCLSFSLFWLLLGKFYGYPLHEGRSKRKAWKLVCESLLGDRGEHERAFRVIEVELCFLYDYFYTKYFFFYLNGIRWKLYLLVFLPVSAFPPLYFMLFFVLIIISLEVIQIGMFICSSWYRVILVSYVARRKWLKKKNAVLTWCIEKVVLAVSQISLCTSAIMGRLWKRQLDQYSLLESCTSFGTDDKGYLQAVFGAGLQIPIPKPGRKLLSRVALSEDVKKAVVLSLHNASPGLSNGVTSLRRNEVENELSWACKLSKDAEVILVWHIATTTCEMSHHRHTSQQHSTKSTLVDFNVATILSKYCAYLLAFSPSLLSIPLQQADLMCDTAIRDARKLLKKGGFLCFKTEETNKYEKLMESLRGEGGTSNNTSSLLKKGLKLGEQLLTTVEDEGRRWKIVAEVWAEMILFLAPSNSNALVHAERLSDGGEFITVLWALLIHAGIVDRQDLIRTYSRVDDAAGHHESGNV